MKRLAMIAVGLGAVTSSPVMAADMPVKAPAYTPPVVAPFSWTGFYIGGSLGGRWTDITWATTAIGDNQAPPDPTTSPASFDSSSFRGGGYLGYNWQFAPLWVVGIEGDVAWANNSKTRGGIPGTFGPTGLGVGPAAAGLDSSEVKLGWDASLRGRIGFLITPTWLLYATGGAVWQHVDINASCSGLGGQGNASWCALPGTTQNVSSVKTGWTIGGGIEAAFWGNWLARVAYRYADFGDINHTFFANTTDQVVMNASLKTHTALVGLAYKF
jgi:outer membrane immunogenic protein